ncbi:MAG: Uma2 family endonuclease [Myxococcota bacterium]
MVARPKPEPGARNATYADVEAAPEGVKAELIDGALMMTPQPKNRHAIAASVIGAELGHAFGRRDDRGPDRPGGWWILYEPECHLEPDKRVVVPDVAGWRRERVPELPRDTHKNHVPPDWVCEVLSPSTRGWDWSHVVKGDTGRCGRWPRSRCS